MPSKPIRSLTMTTIGIPAVEVRLTVASSTSDGRSLRSASAPVAGSIHVSAAPTCVPLVFETRATPPLTDAVL